MMNRRPAPAQRRCDAGAPDPTIVVAIRITLHQPGREPTEVSAHHDAPPLDDAMWRPDGGDIGHRQASLAEVRTDVDANASPLVPRSVAADLEAPSRQRRHAYTDVDLTATSATDAIGPQRRASTRPTSAGSPIQSGWPGTGDTVARRPSGTAGPATRPRRRHTPVAVAIAIAAILAGVAILRQTPRHASTAAPSATAGPTAASAGVSPPPAAGATGATPSTSSVRWTLLDGENGPAATQGGCASSRTFGDGSSGPG